MTTTIKTVSSQMPLTHNTIAPSLLQLFETLKHTPIQIHAKAMQGKASFVQTKQSAQKLAHNYKKVV